MAGVSGRLRRTQPGAGVAGTPSASPRYFAVFSVTTPVGLRPFCCWNTRAPRWCRGRSDRRRHRRRSTRTRSASAGPRARPGPSAPSRRPTTLTDTGLRRTVAGAGAPASATEAAPPTNAATSSVETAVRRRRTTRRVEVEVRDVISWCLSNRTDRFLSTDRALDPECPRRGRARPQRPDQGQRDESTDGAALSSRPDQSDITLIIGVEGEGGFASLSTLTAPPIIAGLMATRPRIDSSVSRQIAERPSGATHAQRPDPSHRPAAHRPSRARARNPAANYVMTKLGVGAMVRGFRGLGGVWRRRGASGACGAIRTGLVSGRGTRGRLRCPRPRTPGRTARRAGRRVPTSRSRARRR